MTAIQTKNRSIEISKPDKILFPEGEITKQDLAEYYNRIAEYMLPYLAGRPISLHRFPDGIEEEDFFQKKVPDYFPDWITRVEVETENGPQNQIIIDSADTLVYLADQGCITLHRWLSRSNNLHQPDLMVFDLDPPGENIEPVVNAARVIRDILDHCGLKPFVMTTGSKGLHIVCPLDASDDFNTVRDFTKSFADTLAKMYPDELTTKQRKNKRKGRVFLDYLRNAYGQTVVTPYAIRALPEAPVATPLDWDELSSSLSSRDYTIENIFQRLGQKNDPWIDMHKAAVDLSKANTWLSELESERDLGN